MEKRTLVISGLILTTLSSLSAGELPSSTQGKEAVGMVNPSSRYQVDNGWNLFLNTEFLWWVAKEDGLYYAQSDYTGALPGAAPSAKVFDGHLHKVKPHFRPGFRIGFGGNMAYDEWDIMLNWTWFQSHARDKTRGLLLTLWGNPTANAVGQLTNGADSAHAKWDLHFNVLDLEMGRSFWVGRHFSLRPFLGLRGAWIDQHLNIHYDYITGSEGRIRAESDFEGGGIRAGLDMRFALLGGWSFYGIASASMLYGFYDCDFHEHFESSEVAESRDGFHNAASTAQLALGVRWDTYVHKDRYHFGLYAGWEQNIWFGINKMNHFFHNLSEGNLEQMNGDLSLSGGTFGVRFDF
ncbi:MAG: hypothetical protein JSS60_01050 [Verrucomicrobia bacterium]|nr:hypothetical protein [Verrucomicrobiota bacterium]